MTYEPRTYRDWVARSGLVSFNVALRESDLMIRATRDLSHQALDLLRRCRMEIERQIRRDPQFRTSLAPLPIPPDCASIVRRMLEAGAEWDVGPMAAVAGAVSDEVGRGLLRWTPEVIVENGGDIFCKMNRPIELGLYAGERSPFTGELKLRVDSSGKEIGICTSSGTVGPSLSFGSANAVVTLAPTACLADAAATAIGNRVTSDERVASVLAEEKVRGHLLGLLIARGAKIGAWGAIELAR